MAKATFENPLRFPRRNAITGDLITTSRLEVMSSIQELGLANLVETYGLRALIETGCYHGDGIAAALTAGFEEVYSCDIDPTCVEHCRNRFADRGGVHLAVGESLAALADFCLIARGPALFWLDAHFPAYYGNEAEDTDRTRYPLPFELEIISKRPNVAMDVIAFDDLRVIRSNDNPRWREGGLPGYFTVDTSLEALVRPFEITHTFSIHYGAEGIGQLLPKR